MLCCLSFDLRSSIFIISPGFLKPLGPSERMLLRMCFPCPYFRRGKINMYTNKGQRREDAEHLFDVLKSAISLHDYFFCGCVSDCICMSVVCLNLSLGWSHSSVFTPWLRLAAPCQRCWVTHLCLQLGKHVNNSNLCAYVCVCVCVRACLSPNSGII